MRAAHFGSNESKGKKYKEKLRKKHFRNEFCTSSRYLFCWADRCTHAYRYYVTFESYGSSTVGGLTFLLNAIFSRPRMPVFLAASCLSETRPTT